MQREIVKAGRLLNKDGSLMQCGYAKRLLLNYNRAQITAAPWRIKEWDYYLITNGRYAVALTAADNAYMGLLSVSLLDLERNWYKTTSKMIPVPFGRLKLPTTSAHGDFRYQDKQVELSFLHKGDSRSLICEWDRFDGGTSFRCNLELYDEPEDSMVIATPFQSDRKAFYYNQKINNMKVKGEAAYGDHLYRFSPEEAVGTLDWGRGVWTYANTWYWGSGSGYVDGKSFGFNIGYGFGDTSAASENMLFYEGKSHKLESVAFHIPRKGKDFSYMDPWRFTSSDGRFEMTFKPVLDRKDHTSIGIISSDQHQVFGHFSGKAVLDDGQIIKLKDFHGFAERVANRW